jgi:hypothetical protein
MPKIKERITFHEVAGESDPNTDDKSKLKHGVLLMPHSRLSFQGKSDHRALQIHVCTVGQEEVH